MAPPPDVIAKTPPPMPVPDYDRFYPDDIAHHPAAMPAGFDVDLEHPLQIGTMNQRYLEIGFNPAHTDCRLLPE